MLRGALISEERSVLARAELWFSPQVLLGLVVLAVGAGMLIWGVPRDRPPLVSVEEDLIEAVVGTRTVQLVLFEASPDERLIETPVRKELLSTEVLNEQLELILEALREEALGDLWPEALDVPTVFIFEIDNGAQQVAVLDFNVPEPIALTVDREKRLLESIKATLLRNGADEVQILINHRESPSFLGHIALEKGGS